MRHDDFNEKYAEYIKPVGSPGLEVTPTYLVMQKLDTMFQSFIKKPNFSFTKLTYKNSKGLFVAYGLFVDEVYIVERLLTYDK